MKFWSYEKFPQIDVIQNKTISIFLGVHKFVSIDTINGDMGWTTSCERRKINMVRFWNRLMSLNDTWLPKDSRLKKTQDSRLKMQKYLFDHYLHFLKLNIINNYINSLFIRSRRLPLRQHVVAGRGASNT